VDWKRCKKAIHGGKGEVAGNLTDFSVNLNPYPPKLDWEISPEDIRAYPDDSYHILKKTIADHHHRNPDEICVGNGSVEVIRTLCHTLLSPGTTVFIPPHTFSEYALSAQLAGASVTHSPGQQTTISFLCNPDNPSGVLKPRDEVISHIPSDQEKEGILCVDEAFIDLADPFQTVADVRNPNLFVLKSLTKTFSMAGVRFGYGIGDSDLIEAMEVMRPPWTINAFAQAMTIQAFRQYKTLEESRARIRQERERIMKSCRDMGLIPSDASANYILLETKRNARELTMRMKNEGILVRDCTSFGLATCIRTAVMTPGENDRLLEALARCLH